MAHTQEALLLGCDIDGTLLAGYSEAAPAKHTANLALGALTMAVAHRRNRRRLPVYFGTATGRTLASHEQLENENISFGLATQYMDFVIGSVGTEITIRTDRHAPRAVVPTWPKTDNWDRHKILHALEETAVPGELQLQDSIAQSAYKLSFYANTKLEHDAYVERVAEQLAQCGIAAQVIFSGERYLDLLPQRADGTLIDKGSALLYCADYLASRDALNSRPRLIFAGDSENDIGGFRAAIQAEGYGIIPGNASTDFKHWAQTEFNDHVYVATKSFAAGVQEGFEHFVSLR